MPQRLRLRARGVDLDGDADLPAMDRLQKGHFEAGDCSLDIKIAGDLAATHDREPALTIERSGAYGSMKSKTKNRSILELKTILHEKIKNKIFILVKPFPAILFAQNIVNVHFCVLSNYIGFISYWQLFFLEIVRVATGR